MNVKFLFGWAEDNNIDLPKSSDGEVNISALFDLYNKWREKQNGQYRQNADYNEIISRKRSGKEGKLGGDGIPTKTTDTANDERTPTIHTISELLGREYKNVKGQDAVNKLLREKQGYVKNAFYRDDIGDIALVWGNEKFGLKHIIERRTEQGMDAIAFLADLSDVVEHGKLIKVNNKGRYELYRERKVAVIEPDRVNGQLTMLITAFKRRKEPR